MDLQKVLTQLREELADIDAAIRSLERLQEVSGAAHHHRKPRVQPGPREGVPPPLTGQAGAASGSAHPRLKEEC